MSKPTAFARAALAAAAGAMAFAAAAAPTAAAAQPYGYYGDGYSYGAGYYDPCRRDATNRGAVGALVGAGIGATVGSQIAARGHRTDGSVVGGLVGALAGAAVGSKSAACAPGYRPYDAPRAYRYDGYGDRGYRYGSGYGYDDRWAYGEDGDRYRLADRPPGADGCTLAESPIYLPDGRIQKRFVRVCMDTSGRYQVVD